VPPQKLTTKDATDISGFASAWNEFFEAVRRARGRAARDAGPGTLTLSQYQLIAALKGDAQMTVGDVALAGGVAAPTATRMLATLEREGIVRRQPSEADRRQVLVSLTPAGQELLAEKRKVIAKKQRQAFSMLSETEREQAEHIMRRLAAAIEEL
jgi:MarR family transcriptional regulator, organic hydroperoxide resistance regulator